MLPTLTQEDYEIRLITHLLDNRFLRQFDGKLVTSRTISDETVGFETEDSLCREWLLSVYDSFSFYEGFDTWESCINYIRSSHYDNHLYRIVEFSKMFYAVIYENSYYQQVIGKEISYYTKSNIFLCATHPPANLTLKERTKLLPNPLIYYELQAFDPDLKIYELQSEDTLEYKEVPVLDAIEYAVLLGVTFKDIWYKCDTPHAIAHNRAILNLYFNSGHSLTLFGKYSNAIAINPFQRLVYLARGRIEHFQMDLEDLRAQQRLFPYREVRRYHENIRIRPVQFDE